MHGHVAYDVFLQQIAGFLGSYYLLLSLMNGVAAYLLWMRPNQQVLFRLPGPNVPVTSAFVWLLVSLFFLLISPLAYSGDPEVMSFITVPAAVRALTTRYMNPTIYILGTFVVLLVMFLLRRFLVQPSVAWTMLNLSLLLMGMSIPDQNFASIVTKPDNVPIVGLIFLLGFFTWLSAYQAVINDDRLKQGLEPLEKLDNEKVLVWPDLVYTELICMIALTAVLLFWAIALQAPLEEPASSVKTPNPSKAPWYFLGLQEMLVYYDHWMAGVVLPSLVIVGLMAIPYIDFNKAGNGYYTIEQRKFAYIVFQIGFLEMWITLIILGTFLRGPNWNFFGPYEYWDAHKVLALNNVDLSQYFWNALLNQPLPKAPSGAGMAEQIFTIIKRESVGIIALALYFIALPPLMAATVFRRFFVRMGFIRFMVMANLLLFMAALPLKMVLRWTLNLKYIVAIPEYFLNF